MASNAVARIGARQISLTTLTNAMARRGGENSPEQTRAVLEDLIRFEALLAKARAAGYDRQTDVVQQLERLVVARFREDQIEARLTQAGSVGDEEIQAYYASHLTNYTTPESVRGGILHFKVSAKAEPEQRRRAQQEAEAQLAEARQTDAAGFARLVQARSEDQATRYIGGDTGWLTRGAVTGRWPGEVVAALFALSEAGQCGPLVAAPQGFYIVRLAERRPAQVRPLAEVQDSIRYVLAREKRQRVENQFYQDLKAGLPIEINQGLLDRITAPGTYNQQRPPPLPGG